MRTRDPEKLSRPLRIIVTGATGFIGSHTVDAALARGHEVTAVGRNAAKAEPATWAGRAEFIRADLHAEDFRPDSLRSADVLMHLAWPSLSDFHQHAHVAVHLPHDICFLEQMIAAGTNRILITGTCLEYGLKTGALNEKMTPAPILPYAVAKDSLRRHLESQTQRPFSLQWARLFYTYGRGQNSKSILAQLDSAIDRGDPTFPMSGGEQIRDYLPVEEIARRLVRLAESPAATGVFNICSGKPISIRQLVEDRIAERRATITPDLNRYPYLAYESMAFWGDGSKYHQEIGALDD